MRAIYHIIKTIEIKEEKVCIIRDLRVNAIFGLDSSIWESTSVDVTNPFTGEKINIEDDSVFLDQGN